MVYKGNGGRTLYILSMDLNRGEWTPLPSNCYTPGEKASAI